jgi:hypothetical protein
LNFAEDFMDHMLDKKEEEQRGTEKRKSENWETVDM